MRIFTLMFALILLTNPANATPPQLVEVSETLFGINDTHLFVLRRLDDNMGSHYPTQSDVVLIARNRVTYQDDQIWPVIRMIDHGDSFAEFGFKERVEPLPLPDRVNPFDIMLWRKARPLLGSQQRDPTDRGVTILRTDKGMDLGDDGDNYRLLDTSISGQITASLNTTRSALPAYFIEGGSRGSDSLRNIQMDPANDCKYTNFYTFSEQINESYTNFWLARIECENFDFMTDITMYFLIPKVP